MYNIIRMYFDDNPENEVIKEGLSLDINDMNKNNDRKCNRDSEDKRQKCPGIGWIMWWHYTSKTSTGRAYLKTCPNCLQTIHGDA